MRTLRLLRMASGYQNGFPLNCCPSLDQAAGLFPGCIDRAGSWLYEHLPGMD
jgi:hypothetical protein